MSEADPRRRGGQSPLSSISQLPHVDLRTLRNRQVHEGDQHMPRPPNYSQERQDRDRAKANKKAQKLALKAAAKEQDLDNANAEAKAESKD